MQTYALTTKYKPKKTKEKTMALLMRGQVLTKSRAVWNRSTRYQRKWFRFMPGKRGLVILAVEVRAHDLLDAIRRADLLLRPTVRGKVPWTYWGAYSGSWMKLRKVGRS